MPTGAEAPQVTVCSSEAGLLIWIKPQLVLQRPGPDPSARRQPRRYQAAVRYVLAG
jgi:hypothetical protein